MSGLKFNLCMSERVSIMWNTRLKQNRSNGNKSKGVREREREREKSEQRAKQRHTPKNKEEQKKGTASLLIRRTQIPIGDVTSVRCDKAMCCDNS